MMLTDLVPILDGTEPPKLMVGMAPSPAGAHLLYPILLAGPDTEPEFSYRSQHGQKSGVDRLVV